MSTLLRSISRLLEFAAEPGIWPYLVKAKQPSLSSYRICQAMDALVEAPATVLDVGANQGQFAGAVAQWFPSAQIVSFEPAPSVFPILRKNTATIPQIQLVQSALGNDVGELEFFESRYSHASSALPVTETQKALRAETSQVRRVVVPMTTLDAFSQGRNWARPLLLKLDVQGYEKRVLEGAHEVLSRVDYLLFECSYRALYEGEPLFSEMHAYVTGLGFELIAPVGYLEDENHVMLQTDLLWRRRRN